MGNEPNMGRIRPGLRDPVDSLARADEIMHRDCREKIAALETELAAWQEVGEILDAKNFYCMVCGGGTSRTKEGHRPDCKLAALLEGK